MNDLWKPIENNLPRIGELIVFCENTNLKTVHVGWMENKESLRDPKDNIFIDSSGNWFSQDEILAWFYIPEIKF